MKRILALLLAMMMIAGMMVSCTGSEEEEEEEVKGAQITVCPRADVHPGFRCQVLLSRL